jgi:hypothetical protein
VSHGDCCEGDGNPWRREPICHKCGDTGSVSKTEFHRRTELTPCPFCGDPEAGAELYRKRIAVLCPRSSLTENDLTADEKLAFKAWRDAGHHAADCLRWIEGRRYDPAKDADLLEAVARERRARADRTAGEIDRIAVPEWWRLVKADQHADLGPYQQAVIEEYLRRDRIKLLTEHDEVPW